MSTKSNIITNNKFSSYLSKVNISVNICVFFMLLSVITTAQVSIKTDTTKIRIGEQFNYEIHVNKTKGVAFYKLKLDSLQKIEVIKSHKIDTLKEKLIKKYTLTSFDSGRYKLPKQLVKIFTKPIFTDSVFIDVSTVAIDTIKQPLFPIKAIQKQELNLKDYAKNLWWLWLLLPILAIAVWYFFIRKKETEQERVAKIPPFEMAVQQLEVLDKKLLWQNNKTKQYYSELTDIIRIYLEKELKVQALESTTNELINDIKKINNVNNLDISNKIIIKLKTLLQEADLVKFAKSKPFATEIEMHRSYAENVLSTIQPSITKYKEEHQLIQDDLEVTKTVTTKKSFPNNFTRKQKRNIIIIIFVSLFLASSIYFSKKIYQRVMLKMGNMLDTKSTEKLYHSDWKVQKFANNTLSFITPVILEEKELIKLPESIQKLIISMKSHEYISLVNQLQIMSMYFEYVEEVQVNLDQAVAYGINSLKAKPGVTDFQYDNEKVTINNLTGKRVFGSYKDNKTPRDFQIFVFVKANKMYLISLGNKPNDEFGEKIINKLINSINIENAE